MINDEMAIRRAIGDRIRKIRKKRGYTQEKLAELLDVSIRFISQIERGQSNGSLHRLIQLSDALDIDVFELLLSNVSDTHISNYRQLTERDKNLVDGLIEDMLKK